MSKKETYALMSKKQLMSREKRKGTMINMLLFIGTTELLLIGGMALLLFGGKKLPEMMRGLGQGVKEFKKGMNEVKAPLEEEDAGNGNTEDAVASRTDAKNDSTKNTADGK